MPEWTNGAVLKTAVHLKWTGGSNPPPAATLDLRFNKAGVNKHRTRGGARFFKALFKIESGLGKT